jgi:hypothetical protein
MAKKKEKEVDVEIEEVEKVTKENHIIIEEADFRMESVRPNDVRFFDLYFAHIVNEGKENERKEFQLEGYGVQLKSCIRRICARRAGNIDKKQFTSFKEFVETYQKQVNEVKALFDLLPDQFE